VGTIFGKCLTIIYIKSMSFLEEEYLRYEGVYNTPKNRQVRIGKYRVDGYKITTNTIYEFLGDYWHGNPEVYDFNDINKLSKKTYGELYERTFDRLNDLRDMGYTVIYVWSKDWLEFQKGDVSKPKTHILE